MDTTKNKKYIKMCEKADEIQKARPIFYVGNTYTYFETGMGFMIHGRHTGVFFKTQQNGYALTDMPNSSAVYLKDDIDLKKVLVWLPTQSQLQEMVIKKPINYESCGYLIVDFKEFVVKECFKNHWTFNSMEQLWLAFLYDKKYNKFWNGSDWVLKK